MATTVVRKGGVSKGAGVAGRALWNGRLVYSPPGGSAHACPEGVQEQH